MGNSSLLERSLRFFKRAPHLTVLACLHINDNFLKNTLHFLETGPRPQEPSDQPALYKQPVRPGQIVHTIALNITLKTYEIDN